MKRGDSHGSFSTQSPTLPPPRGGNPFRPSPARVNLTHGAFGRVSTSRTRDAWQPAATLLALVHAWFDSSALSPLERALILLLGGPAALPLGFVVGLICWPSRRRLIAAAIIGCLISLAFWVAVAFASAEEGEVCDECGEWFGRPVAVGGLGLAIWGHMPLWLLGIGLAALVQSGRRRRRARATR